MTLDDNDDDDDDIHPHLQRIHRIPVEAGSDQGQRPCRTDEIVAAVAGETLQIRQRLIQISQEEIQKTSVGHRQFMNGQKLQLFKGFPTRKRHWWVLDQLENIDVHFDVDVKGQFLQGSFKRAEN